MADDFEYWVHGVGVTAEKTPHLTGHRNGLSLRPSGGGTMVRQARGTSNWFHFDIPTPTRLDDWPSYYQHVLLRAQVGDSAEIRAVHAWAGDRKILDQNFSKDRGPRGELLHKAFDLADNKARLPISVNVRVKFDAHGSNSDPERYIKFIGAGVNFEEQR